MLESLLVYTSLATFMIICGIFAAKRSERFNAESVVELGCQENGDEGNNNEIQDRTPFFTPEILLLLLSFAFVFGCRWGVGRDFYRYLASYSGTIPERWEFLFMSISILLKKVDVHFSVYFGVWALFDITLLYYSVRHHRYIFPYLAFFLIFGSFYLPMMNAIRQHIAAAFFLVSIYYIDKGSIVKFFICYFLAVQFHNLALILFVFYPLLRMKNDWFNNIYLQLALFIFAIFLKFKGELVIRWIEIPFEWLTDLLDYDKYRYEILLDAEWDNKNRFGNQTGLGIYVNIIKIVPIILYSKLMKAFYNSSYFNLLYTLFFISVLSSLIFSNSIILGRITYFFSYFQLLMFSFYVYFCFQSNNMTAYIGGLLLIFIQFPLFFNFIANEMSTAQFSFFWENDGSPLLFKLH